MKTLKKSIAALLVVLMLLSSAPIQGFTGIDLGLDGVFSTEAEAATGLSGYYADAAAEWAIAHWNDYNSVLLGKGYWNDGGDCANFVSQCLFMGGMDMELLWHTSGYFCHWTETGYESKYYGSFIRVDQLYNYLVAKGATVIKNPKASQVSIGDVILYAAKKESDKTHSAIVTDIVNGVPKIAYHSTGKTRKHTTDWHINFKESLTFLIKLNGKTCKNGNIRNITVYKANGSPKLYKSTSTSSALKTYMSGEYTHVFETKTVNNVKWGKTFRYGKWGWIKLSQFTKQGTYTSTSSGHTFGDWYTTKNATCTQEGARERVCSKCGYKDKGTIAKTPHSKVAATCTVAEYCSVCKTTFGDPPGHDFPSTWTIKTDSSCTAKGIKIKVCRRCGLTESGVIDPKGHSMGTWYEAKKATCTEPGLMRRDCNRNNCSYYETETIPVREHNYDEGTVISYPTCTEVGIMKYECQYQDCKNQIFVEFDVALGHDMSEWYVITPATDNAPGRERSDCQREGCYYFEERDIVEHEHKYSDWTIINEATCLENGSRYRICSICHYNDTEVLTATGHKVNVIEFGSYPQSRVYDEELLTELNALVSEEDLISYEYYSGTCDDFQSIGNPGSMTQSDSMQYVDIEYNGEMYRYVQINVAKPKTTIHTSYHNAEFLIAQGKVHSLWSYQHYNDYYPPIIEGIFDETPPFEIEPIYINNESYWFKFEPINWRVLNQDDGLVLSENLIDGQPYQELIYDSMKESDYVDGEYVGQYYGDYSNKYYATNYAESSIREWLNDDFYNTAFTEEEKGLIIISEIDNDSDDEYGCKTTKDKVFLMSYDEMTSFEHYFDVDDSNNVARVAESSDYAKCQGVLANRIGRTFTIDVLVSKVGFSAGDLGAERLNRYWLRTNNGTSSNVKVVNANGSINENDKFTTEFVADNGVGVRPAMRLDCIEILRDDKAPTCTEKGYIGDEYCYVCNEVISTGYEIDALGHEYAESNRVPATCTESGVVEESCTRCGDTKIKEVLDPLGHNMGDWYVVNAATCVEYGLERRDCLREDCNYYEDHTLEKLEHTPVVVKGEVPTCELPGLSDGEACNFCGKVFKEQETIPALGHSGLDENDKEVWIRISDPICSTPGREELHCTRIINGEKCDHLIDSEDIPALEPDYYVSSEKKSTCSDEGYIEYTCKHCNGEVEGHKYGKILPKLPHTYVDADKDGEPDWEVIIEAICVNGGLEKITCTVCGEFEERDIPAPFEEHDLETITVNSTCIEGGHEYKDCTRCDYTEGYIDIDPTGHNMIKNEESSYAATCTEEGLDFYECINDGCDLVCKDILPSLGHDEIYISSTEPTCTEFGFDTFKCQRDGCDYEYDVEMLDALGHNEGQWVVIDKADCFNNGEKELHCTRTNAGVLCDARIETVHIFSREHTWSEWQTITPALCEEDGLEKRECINEETVEYDACTACEENILPAIGHDWDDGVIDPESTCKLHGTKTYTCKNDNSHKKTESVDINPDNHVGETYIKDDKVATCTEDGYTGDKYCSDCDVLLEKGTTINKLDHVMGEWSDNNDGTHTRECQRTEDCTYTETEACSFGDWVVTKEATCTAKGSKERNCAVCGYKETEEIGLRAHTPGEAVTENRTEPKCEEKGSYDEVVYCTECNDELGRDNKEIEPIGHAWDNGVIDPESTCKLHGTKTYTCKNDNSHKKTESVDINPDNHVGETYIKGDKVATCTEDGYTGDKYCSDCDVLLAKGTTINKLDHIMGEWNDNNNGTHTRECQRANDCTYTETEACTFNDWVVTKNATCTEEGSKERVCTICGYIEIAEIEPVGHAYGETVIENKVDPKCEEKGSYDEVIYCKECKQELRRDIKEIEPIGHKWDNGVIDPESTCKLHGTKTYTCQNDNSHKKTESVELNPNNHVGETYIKGDKVATCTEDGYTGDKYCSDCDALLEKGEVVPATDHDWGEWKVSKEATIDAKGEEKRICKRDSSHIETRETDKLISYTAYFIKANDNGNFEYNGKKYDLVNTVKFAKDTRVIVNPDVPQVDGFIGYWEDYELNNEDIYIEAVYELKSSDNQSDLVSNKDVVYKDGVATIALSAFAETLNAKVPMGATPYDIILVMDQSSSMTSYKIGKDTRLAVLERVAKDFVTTVYNSAVENNVDHRVALVSFSGTKENYKGTGIIGVNGTIKTFNKLTNDDYASAFIDVKDNLSALKNGIDSLTGISGTSSDYGLQIAKQILANNQDGREKLVLFITDGEPGDPGRNMGAFNYTVANEAIEYANQIKNLYDTTIYSIGVAAGADPADETNKINKFLHYVSSNYPEAKNMDTKGTAATMKNYFLSAENSDEIEEMFESIVSRQIINTISFTKVNFYDTVSEYFTLTTENENALRETVKAEYGVSDSDIIITRNDDGTTTVRINNLVPKAVFDDNNVQIGYGATVKFDVTANEKTLEGGTFKTNTEDAGIENDGKTVIEFKVPDGQPISSGRAIVEFRIGDEVYAIREVSIGDKVVVPETDVADWVVTDGTTITSDYTVFNADYTSETRTVKWIIDGEVKEDTYHIGEIIFAPDFTAPEGKLFKGWNLKVPYRMPDYDLEFTAIFETHEHSYKERAKSGECVTGITVTYTCDCGSSYNETKKYDAHNYTANVQLVNDESIATMSCTICGKAESKTINYKAQYDTNSWWNKTQVVDLTLYDNAGIVVQPNGYIYVKLYSEGDVLSNAKTGKLIIKRVNENNTEDNIPYLKNSSTDSCGYYVEGNYIVLKLDHFSYYALITPEDAANVPSFEEIECAFNGHSYTSKVVAPTCTANGYTAFTCTKCGDVYNDAETTALGHNVGAYTIIKQSTCTDNGTETAKCTRCTYTESRSVSATGHDYKNGVCSNCGADKSIDCSCNCHKGGFAGLIFKIILFFQKIFKMNKVCSCGKSHY